MQTIIEKPHESKDWGDAPTIKIQAFEPRDIFRLGGILQECVRQSASCVHGETGDKKGMYLRFPLVPSGYGVRKVGKTMEGVLDEQRLPAMPPPVALNTWAVGDRFKVKPDPALCDPLYHGRTGEVVELTPGDQEDAIGCKLDPLELETAEEMATKKFIFNIAALDPWKSEGDAGAS